MNSKENSVRVFPNPANEKIYIEGTDLLKSTNIKISNLLGEAIFEIQTELTASM